MHVRDVAHANVLALDDDAPSGVFNVASGDPHTVGEMAKALADAHGHGLRPVVTGSFRLGDVRHVFASIARGRRISATSRPSVSRTGCASSRPHRCATTSTRR